MAYTDGSGIDQRIGASAVLYCNRVEVASLRLCLGSAGHHTVFEGEGVGASLALALLKKQPEVRGAVSIVVDSQPAINAVRATAANPSHWIWDRAFAVKHPDAMVTVRWAPGHVGIPGNEHADEEAKKVAQIGSSPEHTHRLPRRTALE
ncbi:ribonuclease H-like domain-containing protein [Mycena filopes]|nr:ribonuclease H-like domain-containing protein [Mycena filopes]